MNPSKWKFLLILVLPTFLLYFYICILPMIGSIFNSVYDWNGYGPKKFVGLGNYVRIFGDSVFWESFRNDVIITFFKEIIIVLLAVLFAVSLTQAKLKRAEVNIFRFLYYIPNIMSVIVISMVWKYFFESFDSVEAGWNIFASKNGIWVDRPLALIIFIACWAGIGHYMIVLITAINNISPEILDAAALDGAGQIRRLRYIILPSIRAQIRYVMINVLAGSLAVNMNLILPLTGGQNHTMVMGLYIYNYGTSQLSMVGYAYAAAVVLMSISFGLCFTVNVVLNRKEAKEA